MTQISSRHYRVCAYCSKREYGDNIPKLMRLAPYGKNDRSESHFVHRACVAKAEVENRKGATTNANLD